MKIAGLTIGIRMVAWRSAGALALLAAMVFAWPSAPGAGETRVQRIGIADPGNYWRDNGYVVVTPAIRVSVFPGADTKVFLRIPPGGLVRVRHLAGQGRHALLFPPGSASDRVTFSQRQDGRPAIDDVRGTRWGDDGAEYFRVLRPTASTSGAPLAGYEWRRGDAVAQQQATDALVSLLAVIGKSERQLRPSRRDLGRFRSLNQCEGCHQADKPAATDERSLLPPWPTDGNGLYVPAVVFDDSAPLSSSDAFDDPNAGDKFVTAFCPAGDAALHGDGFSRWFTCPDGAMPVGRYDLAAALKAGEIHAKDVCATRRYVYRHLDAAAARVYDQAMAPCRNAAAGQG